MQSSRTPESQQAGITALALGDALTAVRMLVRPLSWSLTGTRSICRSSPMIEAYILSNVVEQELQTWAVVFDMKRQFNVHQTIDLPTLKQFIWDNHDVRDEELNGLMNCYSLWVDTPATLSDYLSKKMTSQQTGNTSSTKVFDTRPDEKNPSSKKRTRSGEARGKEQERPQDPDS